MRSDDITIPHLNFQKYFFLLKIRAVHFYETSYVNQAVWKKNFTRTPERITSSISKLHKNRNASFTVAQDKNLTTFHNLQVTIPKATAIWNSEFILVVSSFPDKNVIEFRFGENVSFNIWSLFFNFEYYFVDYPYLLKRSICIAHVILEETYLITSHIFLLSSHLNLVRCTHLMRFWESMSAKD